MSSLALGNNTSAVEVTNISQHGVWLLAHDKELFMSYKDFPWFKNQTIESILNVEEPNTNHFYWPDIDVDLTIDNIFLYNPFIILAEKMNKFFNI